MIKNLKSLIVLLPFLFTAFSFGDQEEKVEYYNNFHFLKDSGEPREIKIIKTENLGNRKSILEKGILLTYKNRYAGDVKIAGDFSNWKTINMNRGKYGIWYYFLAHVFEDKICRYKFNVDGIWTSDPANNERDDDGASSYVSVLYPLSERDTHALTFRFISSHEIEFRIYRPKAKFVSIVGDFNNWNPENDLLEKDKEGIWSLRKKLFPGMYKYKYIIDGSWTLDVYNENTAGDPAEGICSLLKIGK